MPKVDGEYDLNPQQAKAKAAAKRAEQDERMTAELAGYMELDGAKKDGDCKIVRVDGGISQKLGCCDHYRPEEGARAFCCEMCIEVVPGNP
jgi:hypothetical protein